MTTAVQRRRGTNTEHASFTGLEGEISVNTTNESVHVHDGSTAGGFELMRADGANSTVTLGDISGVTAGTGLSGGGTTGTVTLDIDGTVATLAGTQTFTNKTLTSPILNTPTIGTSFTIGGATITEAELEILDGATVTTTELNYVDGVTSAIQTQIDAKAPIASPSFTGNVSVGGTVDGRDVAADGTKLDGIEASADVTDTANVTAAGALMDSELTSEASVKALNQGVATTDSPAFAGLTVDTDTLAVDSTNNRVGIGTTSPSTILDVKGAAARIRISDTDTAGTTGIEFVDSGGTKDAEIEVGNSTQYLAFKTATAERMRIDSSGKVGIGTTSPTTKLDVDGQGCFKKNYSYASTNYHIKLKSTYGNGISSYIGNIASGDRMNISAGGYYYGSSLYQLTDGATGMGTINIGEDGTLTYQSTTGATANSTVNPSERMRIDSSGNLLLGTTSSPASTNPKTLRYGVGVQAGSISTATPATAGVVTTMLNMAGVTGSSQSGAGLYLVTIVRDGGSYATHFVGIYGVNSSSVTLYEVLHSGGMTMSVSGTRIRANVGSTDTYDCNAIPLSIHK